MDLSLKLNEKIAFLHALISMMVADGNVSPNEMNLINKFVSMKDVNVGQAEFDQARAMSDVEAKNILSQMSDEKKRLLGFLLQDMAHADGVIDEGEKLYWMKIKSDINITNINDL